MDTDNRNNSLTLLKIIIFQRCGVKWTDCNSSISNSDFVYLGLIGDRRLAESQFGKIQIDRTEEIRKWTEKFKEVK